MTAAIDPQANGWIDDGTEGGVVRTAVAGSGLVLCPIGVFDYAVSGGTTSVTSNPGVWSVADPRTAHRSVQVKVDSAANANATVSFRFKGKALGLALCPTSTQGFAHVSALIDGQAFDLPTAFLTPPTESVSVDSAEMFVPIADNLPDGTHNCQLIFSGDGSVRYWDLHGFYAEERAGYAPVPPNAYLFGTARLATLNTRYQASALWSGQMSYVAQVSSIILANLSSGAVKVTVDNNSTAFWYETLAAFSTKIIAFPLPVAMNAFTLGFTADTSAAVDVTLTAVNR